MFVFDPDLVRSFRFLFRPRYYRVSLTFALAIVSLLLVEVSINLGSPYLFKDAIDGLSGVESTLFAPGLSIGLYFAGLALGRSVGAFTMWNRCRRMVENQSRMGQAVLKKLGFLPYAYFLERKRHQILSVLTESVAGMEGLADSLFVVLIPVLLQILLVLILIAILFPAWVIGLLLVSMTIFLTVTVLGSNRLYKRHRAFLEANHRAYEVLAETVTNFETVKLFDAGPPMWNRWKHVVEGEFGENYRSFFRGAAIVQVMQTLIAMSTLMVLLLASISFYQAGETTLGSVVLTNIYAMQLLGPLQSLGHTYRTTKAMGIRLGFLEELLEEQDERVGDGVGRPQRGADPEIRFDHLSFGYGRGLPTLEDVSFTVHPGERVAIVGPTGAGKTTIAKLLLRYFEPTEGRILFGGINVLEMDRAKMRAAIGYIPQEIALFNESLRFNLDFARGRDLSEIREVLEAASLDTLLLRLYADLPPEGSHPLSEEEKSKARRIADIDDYSLMRVLDHEVGDRGLKLSGGERQRIGIARALLQRPDFFLFDEATSALDNETEREVTSNLERISARRTTLMIAHRLSTVIGADRLLVFDRGRLVQEGPPDDLLRDEGGMFARLHRAQSKAA